MLSRDDGFSPGAADLPARVLLAGQFARPGCLDRTLIEALIGAEHDVLPEPAGLAPASLGNDGAADVVVVDLSGSVASVLALVAQLRVAVDAAQVPLLGVMPSGIDPRSAIYLAAVVDETVSHAQMVERLPSAVRRATRLVAWPVDDEALRIWHGDGPTDIRH
ncbi:hypothetical protein [Lichenicoccus sp.]|uniref:hypothetical protein n=1 Tax=Lichenicoccus sp. TaxID=2781899 RepID=UPI003D0F6919